MPRLRPRMTNGNPGNGNGDGGAKATSLSELTDKLVRLGMPHDEASVYVRLQNIGPSKAGHVADALGVTRQKVYRTFEAMAMHGFALSSTTRPRVYTAAQPGTVIQMLHGRLEALEDEFDDALTQTVPSLEALRGLRIEHPQVHFTLLRGVDAVTKQAQQMCRDAQEKVRVLFGAPNDRPLVHSVAATDAIERLDARVLLARKAAGSLSSLPPAEVRVVDLDPLATSFLVDDRECLVVVSPQDGKRGAEPALAYRTNAPGVVAVQHVAFEEMWRSAGPYKK